MWILRYQIWLSQVQRLFAASRIQTAFIFEKKGSRFIILKNQTFDLSKFLIELETLESKEEEKKRKNKLSQQFLHQAINALDTEYDKMTLKAILCFFLSTKECCELGIVTEKAAKWIEKMQVAITETANAELAAGDIIKLRTRQKQS